MEFLRSEQIDSFAKDLRTRMLKEQDYTLLPVVGSLHWFGKLFFGGVYVDRTDALLTSTIVLKTKTLTAELVEERRLAQDHGQLMYQRWKETYDRESDEYGKTYGLTIWCDKNIEWDWNLIRPLIQDHDQFTIKCTDHSLVAKFPSSFPKFQNKGEYHASISVLQERIESFPCPEGYVLKTMSVEDTSVAMASYKYGFRAKYNLEMCAAWGLGVGAYHIESNSLASFAFIQGTGVISGLMTLPNHRGKGLAKAVISRLVEVLHGCGAPVYCFIEKNNIDAKQREINLDLFHKLGFKTLDNVSRLLTIWA